MEPGDLRESPAGSGESDGGDWRELVPGGEEGSKAAGASLDLALKDTYEGGRSAKERRGGGQLHSPYEEELDPRIQVGGTTATTERRLSTPAGVTFQGGAATRLTCLRGDGPRLWTDAAGVAPTNACLHGVCLRQIREKRPPSDSKQPQKRRVCRFVQCLRR